MDGERLVEAGVAFVTLDLSYHPASGTWDTHGDNIPPYGGIKSGLGPLLPLFDHLLTTLGDWRQPMSSGASWAGTSIWWSISRKTR